MSEETKHNSGDGVVKSVSGEDDPGRRRGEVRITWDEETIAEHNKLRGTRQKIDEPSTPYHYASESSAGSDCESTDGRGFYASGSVGASPGGSPFHSNSTPSHERDRRHSILKVMADVSAALPSESALRRERQARWDSDVSDGSATEDKEKARKFKQRREAHYNEFRALREWRAKSKAEDHGDNDMSDSDNEYMFFGSSGGGSGEEKRRQPDVADVNGASNGPAGMSYMEVEERRDARTDAENDSSLESKENSIER